MYVIQSNKEQLEEYAKEKAKALERIRENAQSAYSKAQDAKKIGDIKAALQWMKRAHRLTQKNPNIIFELAVLYLKTENIDEAFKLIQSLLKEYDFYEGWIAQAVLLASRKSVKQLFNCLNYFLSHFCPSLDTWSLVVNILRQNHLKTGCACVIGSLNEVWIESFMGYPVEIYLDHQFYCKTDQKKITLPSGYQKTFKTLRVEKDGQSYIGSPINLQKIHQMIGYVAVEDSNVKGWAWYPAEPERIPLITVKDQKGNIFHQLSAIGNVDVLELDMPLVQPKPFSIPIDKFPSGMFSFQDELSHNLIGSPLDPTLEQRGCDFLIHLQTPALQKKNVKVQNLPYFFPIKASYRGIQPAISHELPLGTVIVIPVYKGKEVTVRALQTVLKTVPKNVIVQLVDDASSDEALIEALTEFIDEQQVFCIHHPFNKGFPAAVNSGMAAWPGYDVVLLNSDVVVGNGWLETLAHAAYQDENIGTVTPFSNDAGIFSYPCADKKNIMPSDQILDEFAKILKKVNAHQTIEIPTAHGFCMYIRHDCLTQTGLFREDLFAQGYGEENDFCMRARHLGWKHVLATDCYVGHVGSVSFAHTKQFLSKRNIAILNRLYPGYDELIQDFIREDHLLFFRRAIDLERVRILLEAQKEKNYRFIILVTHQLGGGVQRFVQERTDYLRLKGFIPVLIKPTGVGNGTHVTIQFGAPNKAEKEMDLIFPNLVFYFPYDEAILFQFLETLSVEFYEIHHLKYHYKFMIDLLYKLNKPYDVYIHDYLIFCPRTVLLTEENQYCGDPCDLRICQACVNSLEDSDDGMTGLIDMQDWIKRAQYELEQARTVYVPSKDTLRRISKHFPTLKQLEIQMLEDDRPDLSLKQLAYFSQRSDQLNSQGKIKLGQSDRFRVCIIGAIGVEKGYDIIQALLQDADKRDLPIEFVLVGRSADDEKLMRSNRIFITGEYKEEEAVTLVAEQNADLAFFPSIWPETWCYSLSIAWRAGLKTVGYDIGAISERIMDTKRGKVMPLHFSIAKQNDFLLKECKYVGI